jgi:hypothetical protein
MKWFSLSLDDQKFEVTFRRRAKVLYQDFFIAADHAVQQLRKEFPGPLYLALSGGIDSEFVANTLVRNQIAFTPIIVKTENHNSIESWYAEYWCKNNGIEPTILIQSEQDLANRFVKFFQTMMQLDNFTQVEVLLAYEYASQQNGHCIYGAGDMNPNSNGEFYSTSIDFISDLVNVGNHPTSFFMYTPELALSYITKFDKTLNEQYNKLSFYGVPARPKIDYHKHYSTGEVQKVKEKLCYLHRINPMYLKYNVYGTREQIIQNLQP